MSPTTVKKFFQNESLPETPFAARRGTMTENQLGIFSLDVRCCQMLAKGMTPKRIVNLRAKLKLSQRQLAALIGAQYATVARWETGKNEPRGANLKALIELEKTVKK